MTVGLYSINPKTQRSKWVAIDADYKNAVEHLLKLQYELTLDGVEPALEKSNRGGHLWILFEEPAPAKDCRLYVYHTALRLGLPIKGAGLPEGIEIFPRQDEIGPSEFGNAIRAPLGVHRGAKESRGWRFWYYNADYTLADQTGLSWPHQEGDRSGIAEIRRRQRDSGGILPTARRPETPRRYYASGSGVRILDYVQVRRQAGRNWIARCPSCAGMNRDRRGDNLAISVEEPRKYICWAGCSKEMIRKALGRPIPQKRYA